MWDRCREIFLNKELFNENDKIILAVSGGVDSMVMCELFLAFHPNFSVAHMNYQLRGDESDGDEDFVREWCSKHSIPFFTKKVSVEKSGESTQMEARRLRYEWFNQLTLDEGFSLVATAHNLTDSFETVILNLVRGTGISGLTGIAQKSGKLVRPLLGFSKEEIKSLANERGIHWREDQTNAHSDYKRNKIRNQVLPILKELNPSLLETYGRSKERIEGGYEVFKTEIDRIKSFGSMEDGVWILPVFWLKEDASDAALLGEILADFGFNFVTTKQILQGGLSGRIFESESHKLNVDRDQLVIRPKVDELQNLFISGVGEYFRGGYLINVSISNDLEITTDPSTAKLDLERISFPITVREMMAGDTFIPLGMKGKKKVSDFMIDAKIPRILKSKIPIFETGGEIAWIGNHRVDDRFKITEKTEKCLLVSIKSNE